MINTDGSGITPLTANLAVDGAPSWNAAGPLIPFHSDRDGNQEVYRMSPEGALQTSLTNDAAADGEPNWER